MPIHWIPVVAGGFTFWCAVSALIRMQPAPALAGRELGAAARAHPLSSIRSPLVREAARLALSLVVALGLAAAQAFAGATLGNAIATGQLLLVVPASFTLGWGYGANASSVGLVRAFGLLIAGLAASLVIHATWLF